MVSGSEKDIVLVGDDGFGIDSRLIRRMSRRSVSNKSSRVFSETANNVAASSKDVILLDDNLDNDCATHLDCRYSEISGYVDVHDDRYDDIDVDDTIVGKSSGCVANKCAELQNAEASDAFIDPEYKSFLENSRVRSHNILFCLGNEVITYGQTDDDGEISWKKKTCDSRKVDAEAKRSSKGFKKRGRMSVVGNRNKENQVGPMDKHSQATKSSKSKTEGLNKGGHNCCIELADNDPDYELALNSMEVDASYVETKPELFKKVRYSQDEKNQSDVEVLESNKQEKKNSLKLVDSSPLRNLLSSVAVNGRNKKNITKHCKEVGCDEDEKNESDEEVTILEWLPSSGGERTPFVSSKSYEVFVDDYYKIPNSGRKVCSEYMEELVKYIKKPYDEDEHSQLWEELNRRKLVERDMDLRSGSKRFTTEVMGRSYLDRHKDLHAKIIEAESNERKVLNILRGFFFWLKNITRQGAFRPWMDPSILDIMPHG